MQSGRQSGTNATFCRASISSILVRTSGGGWPWRMVSKTAVSSFAVAPKAFNSISSISFSRARIFFLFKDFLSFSRSVSFFPWRARIPRKNSQKTYWKNDPATGWGGTPDDEKLDQLMDCVTWRHSDRYILPISRSDSDISPPEKSGSSSLSDFGETAPAWLAW